MPQRFSFWETETRSAVAFKDGGAKSMALSQAVAAPLGEKVDSTALAALFGQLPLEPRCRVCRNDALRAKVNGLLAVGASYAMILRALADDNTRLDKPDRVTIDSIRNHTARHFPVQNVARATYREILERRAKENGIDFVNGVTTAITPMALYETIMVRGYQTLVDPDTKVDVNMAMIAAGRLQALIESRASGTNIADMWVQMGRIIAAVKSTVPADLWPEILRRMNGDDAALEPPVDEEPDTFDPDEDPFGDDDLDE
jgi:hypothetical protein